MSKPPLLLTLGGALALLGALALPSESRGQAGPDADPVVAGLLKEITAQQLLLAEGQAKIDEKLATVAEDVRVGRIFVGRGGGKAK